MKTCGICAFAKSRKEDFLQIDCGGVPPTPVMFGFDQVSKQPILKCVPPVLPRSWPACALFKLRAAADDADPLHTH